MRENLACDNFKVFPTENTLLNLAHCQIKQKEDVNKESIYKRAQLAANATPLRNILPTSESVAATIVQHCTFLLLVNPAFPIRLIKHGGLDKAWRDLSLFRVSNSHISLDEVFEFVSQPLDMNVLRDEILRRMERARIRSVGLDLTKYLLTIISPNFGYVKAQAIAQVPYAMARHRDVTMEKQKAAIEKGKGSELADKAKIWSKANIRKLYVIHRFIVKATNHFDPEKGQYWKPPSLSDLSVMLSPT